MVTDQLADVKDNAIKNISFSNIDKVHFEGGVNLADNATVCDSRGNCMVTDQLATLDFSSVGPMPGFGGIYL
jgi:hypothetical protein